MPRNLVLTVFASTAQSSLLWLWPLLASSTQSL
jgi:hypothetical protein